MAIRFNPSFDGTTSYSSCYPSTMSQSGGEIIGKGFTIQPGWSNEGLWEATFQFKHDNIRYTGICFVANVSYNGSGGPSNTLTTWEGSWPGGLAYATYTAGAVGYFDVTVTKLDNTHVRLRSNILNRDTTVEIPWLANMSMVTCGARHNPSGSSYGPCRIKNLVVRDIGAFDNASSVTIGGKTIQSIKIASNNAIIYQLSTLSLSASSSVVSPGSNVTLSGTLSAGANKIVKIYQGSTFIGTATTDANGAFSKSVTLNNVGTETFRAEFEGFSYWSNATSSNVTVNINTLTFEQSSYTATNGKCAIVCTLQGGNNVDKYITLTGTNGSTHGARTDANGKATFDLVGKGSFTYTATYNNLTTSCSVSNLNNKIQATSAKVEVGTFSTGCSSGRYKTQLKITITTSHTCSPSVTAPVTVYYRYRSSSSGSWSKKEKTSTISSTKTSNVVSISSSSCKNYQDHSGVLSGDLMVEVSSNWAFEYAALNR